MRYTINRKWISLLFKIRPLSSKLKTTGFSNTSCTRTPECMRSNSFPEDRLPLTLPMRHCTQRRKSLCRESHWCRNVFLGDDIGATTSKFNAGIIYLCNGRCYVPSPCNIDPPYSSTYPDARKRSDRKLDSPWYKRNFRKHNSSSVNKPFGVG